MKDGAWTDPENMGQPINTSRDDLYFTIPASGDMSYLASSRVGTIGREDIYAVPMVVKEVKSAQLAIMNGKVMDSGNCGKDGCEPVEGAVVTVMDQAGNKIQESVTAAGGVYNVILPAGNVYEVSVKAEGYKTMTEKVEPKADQPYQRVEKNFTLDPG